MSASFLGSQVSVDCGEVLGTYQGKVTAIEQESQTITITSVFRNGIQCQVPHVTISASDIEELKILKTVGEKVGAQISGENNQLPLSTDKLTSRASHVNSRSSPSTHADSGYQMEDNFRKRTNSAGEGVHTQRKLPSPRKIQGQRRQGKEDCFTAPVDDGFLDEFDFEKNLALFDKEAVFEEIENQGGSRRIPNERQQPAKYRCDENVLQSKPIVLRQIKGCKDSTKEYVTDLGLVVPSVSYAVRSQLLAAAVKAGMSMQRQLEMVGRSAAEMTMQLLGGSHRLCPKNAHQQACVVVLAGPHLQGAQSLNCARHLACHNIRVITFVPTLTNLPDLVKAELELLLLSRAKVVSETQELAHVQADLVIAAVDSHDHPGLTAAHWYQSLAGWANQTRAPKLALDPPVNGSQIDLKWSVGFGLPLDLGSKCGQIYLCDLSFPYQVFKEVGITCRSPFSNKFWVALHEKPNS